MTFWVFLAIVWIWCGMQSYRYQREFFRWQRKRLIDQGQPDAAFVWDWSLSAVFHCVMLSLWGPISLVAACVTYRKSDWV